jgi:hypothetical protein
MRIEGVDVPAGAVAELARRLAEAGHKGLAQRFWNAYDTDRDRAGVFANERMVLLNVLHDAPPELTELRDVLQQETGGGQPREGLG